MTTNDDRSEPPGEIPAPRPDAPSSTPLPIQARLCLMMFLQYFVQGCYLPIVSLYVKNSLGFEPWQIGLFMTAIAVGPLVAPFVLGQVVDRYVPTERVLAVCHFTGGLLMLALYAVPLYWSQMVPDDSIPLFLPMTILGTIYSILYMPSLMLTNSLAFHHLKRKDREFPIVRLFGTIGFVVPAWLVEMWWLRGLEGVALEQARGIVFCFAGISGLIMAGYSLSLPHTPPDRRDDRRFAPAAVIGMMRMRHFAVLVVITFLVAIVHNYYFAWNSPFLTSVLRRADVLGAYEQRMSSIGQISEVAVMALLGFAIARFGFKTTLLVGTLAYFTRCLVLAFAIVAPGPAWFPIMLACFGQALHGLCFGCFLATAFIFVDRVAPSDIRGSMQNLFGTFVFGAGALVGGLVAGSVGEAFTTDVSSPTIRQSLGIASTLGIMPYKEGQVIDWPGIWLSCGLLALLCTAAFAVLFPRGVVETSAPATDDPKKTDSG